MHRPKRWNISPPDPAAAELAARLKTSALVAQMLLNRGLREAGDCQAFLRPSLKCLHSPEGLVNLNEAAERIAKGVRDRQKIVIYGDYDVDGITATAILWHAIHLLGGDVHCYIPHRIDEGYGLNAEAIKVLCDEGAKLIVSVDCGITAVEQAKVACERGVDLIITDHHEWREEVGVRGEGSGVSSVVRTPVLPECFTVIHPRLGHGSAAYPNPHLCGAGVAFKLAWGIGLAVSGASRVSEVFREFLLEATALAALGTIADVVPLIGENRILAHFGLTGLKNSKMKGLQALISSAGLTGAKLDAYHVGFLLAPRLNACGRMGHAREAVEMLTVADAARSAEIATYLEQQNRARQAIEKKILDEAVAQVTENCFDSNDCRGIVLGSDHWHPGVIGIVASRIVERFHRPTVMVALPNGSGATHGQGSGRSISGFHLAKALEACREHLDTFGGHQMAAGLKVRPDNFEAFRHAFRAHANNALRPADLTPQLSLEAAASLNEVTEALVQEMQRLGPFGHGNRKPLLCCRGVTVACPPRVVGKGGEHLQVLVRQGELMIKCIAFNFAQLADSLVAGTTIDVAFEPALNEYNGNTTVELELKDVQFPE